MRRSYEFKQENHSHSVHEKQGWATYPSYYASHTPPSLSMQKMFNNPLSFHYEPSDDDHKVVNDSRWIHHEDDGNRGWCGTRQADMKKNRQHGILRPPLGSVSHLPSHQHHHHMVHDQGRQEVKSQNAWRYGEAASRLNKNNSVMEDHSRKFPYYSEISSFEDGYDDEELESLMKGMRRGMVKKIEVIKYERRTYRGRAQEEWKLLDDGAPTNYNNSTNTHYLASYPNNNAPWVKGFLIG